MATAGRSQASSPPSPGARSTSPWTAPSLNTPGNTQRPDLIRDPEILGHVGGGQTWFDITAFAAPAPNTFGNLTRAGAGVNAPAYVNLDASIVKKVPFGSRFAEFRVDAFNVTNSLHPNNPGTTFGSATFGQITGAFDPRLIRFGVRFVF